MIEHIKNDESFLQDVYRVLKPGGMLLLTIPNRELSLTNNPWHVREYSTEELTALLSRCFEKVTVSSVTENQNVMAYYEKNKRAVAELIKYDLLHLKNRLPKHLLRILYDLLNRITRKKLHRKNEDISTSICHEDFLIEDTFNGSSLDIFCVAKKSVNGNILFNSASK